MSAKIETLPVLSARGFGIRLRWMAVAVTLLAAVIVGSLWAFLASSSNSKAPTTPAIQIEAPANPAIQIQAPANPGTVDPRGCGLTIRGGPC